jgi:hypothetical protein
MNAGNRVLWSVIGLVLLAAGVLGVLASQGWLAGVDPDQPVLTAATIQRWNSWGNWTLVATTALAVVLAVLGVLLIIRQLQRGVGVRLRDMLVRERPSATAGAAAQQPPPGSGKTRVASNALHHALTNDLETDRHVRRAAVRITGQPPHPHLHVRLATTADADVAGLADAFDRAVARFSMTTGLRPEVTEVTVTMPDRQLERVH